jgi:hypothetical protein
MSCYSGFVALSSDANKFQLRRQADAGNGVWREIASADRPFQRPKFSAGLESVIDACRIEKNADRILGKFR